MELNVQERLTTVNVLPEKGNFETMKIIEALRKILYPSEEEVKTFEIKQSGNNISWNLEGAKGVVLKFTKAQKEFILKTLNELSDKKEVTLAQYEIYKKFKVK